MNSGDLRRHQKKQAAHRLAELGAPRSVHSLRRDLRGQPGEFGGPKFVRDSRGFAWWWESELSRWAAEQRAQLSENNPPPLPFYDSKAANAIQRAKRDHVRDVVAGHSTSSGNPQENKPIRVRAAIDHGSVRRSGSAGGQQK